MALHQRWMPNLLYSNSVMARKIKNSPLVQRTIDLIVSEKGNQVLWKEFLIKRKEDIDALYQDYLRDLAYKELKGSEAILNQAIDELPFDSRAKNLLKSKGILSVRELIQYSNMDLSHINSLGRVSLQEIEDYLGKVGLQLSKTHNTKF